MARLTFTRKRNAGKFSTDASGGMPLFCDTPLAPNALGTQQMITAFLCSCLSLLSNAVPSWAKEAQPKATTDLIELGHSTCPPIPDSGMMDHHRPLLGIPLHCAVRIVLSHAIGGI